MGREEIWNGRVGGDRRGKKRGGKKREKERMEGKRGEPPKVGLHSYVRNPEEYTVAVLCKHL